MLAAALKQAEGRAQYVVKGRYAEQTVLAEVLAEIPEAARLAQALSDLAADWEGRVEIRLLGPQAPYDFTPTLMPPR